MPMTATMPRATALLPTLLAVAVLATLPVASSWAQSAQAGRNGRNGHGQAGDRGDRGGDRGERGGRQGRDNPVQGRDSLSDAVRRVERDTRGEVLSAERVQYDGRDMHRVKVVDDRGRVRVFMQDPRGAGQRQGDDRDPRPARRDDD